MDDIVDNCASSLFRVGDLGGQSASGRARNSENDWAGSRPVNPSETS